MVAEQIEDADNYRIVVNVCDERSNWTYTEVYALISILMIYKSIVTDTFPPLVRH